MKILINEIPPQGLTREDNLDPAKLKLNAPQINFSSPVHVECFITKVKDDLFAECKLSASIRETCSRCLKEFDMKLDKKADLHYELKGELSIELNGKLKDEIIVDYPIKILCKEGCKGLCPKCGEDLNETSCNCKPA